MDRGKRELVIPKSSPAPEAELKVNGLTLVFYDFYIIDSAKSPSVGQQLVEVKCTHDYRMLFRLSRVDAVKYTTYMYLDRLNIPQIDLPSGEKASGEGRLYFQVAAGKFLLAITVIAADRLDKVKGPAKLNYSKPLYTDDILELINQLNNTSGKYLATLEEQRNHAVQTCFGQYSRPANAEHSRKLIGIQVWDIDTGTPEIGTPMLGGELASRFAWELAALLECTSDIIRIHHAWRNLPRDRVAELLDSSQSVTAQNLIATAGSVCIEAFEQVAPEINERTKARLLDYGYDSTSIYLWNYLALLEFITGYYNSYLSQLLTEARNTFAKAPFSTVAFDKTNEVSEFLTKVVRVKTEIYEALDNVYWITANMYEERHMRFFNDSLKATHLEEEVLRIQQKLEQLTSISFGMNQVLSNRDQVRTMTQIRDLTKSSSLTNRVLTFLNLLLASTASISLAEFLKDLSPSTFPPVLQGIVAITSFVLVVAYVQYIATGKSEPEEHKKTT